VGEDRGFAALVKRQNLATQITHCVEGSQARIHFFKFEEQTAFLEINIFVFIVCLKHISLGTTKLGNAMPSRGYRPKGRPDD